MDSASHAPAVRLEALGPDDGEMLQQLFAECGDYFLAVTGRPAPDADAAERELRECAAAPGREVALLRSATGAAVGALGWWAGYPEPETALLGVLMVLPAARRRGVARTALAELDERLAADGVRRLRAGVASGNGSAQAALRALGFRDLDDRRHVSLDAGRLMIGLWERDVGAP